MGAVFYILLGWLLAVGACYSFGAILLRGTPFSREETIPLRFVCGAAVYSLLTFFLGLCHLYFRATFVVLAAIAIGAAWRMGALKLPGGRLPALTCWQWRCALLISGPFVLLYLSNAMAPEASPDGSAYHLGLVARYFRGHALYPVNFNMYAALSQGMEMLFLGAYAAGRHSAAALMHFTFLLALPWLLLSYGRRIGMPNAGIGSALLVFASPVVGIDGISAYNDVAAACVLFSLYVVLRSMEDHPELAWVAGLLAGFGFAIKYTLFPASLLTGVWIVWRLRSWKPLLPAAAAALVSVVPWLAKNIVWWHNPFAPFFNAWFPNPNVQQWFELVYKKQMASYGLPSYWLLPIEATVRGTFLNGLLGPVFLLAPIALLALRYPEGRRVLLTAAFVFSAYPSNIGTRFLIPGLPFLAFAMAMALPRPAWLPIALAAGHALLSLPAVIPSYCHPQAWRLNKWPWRQALRIIPEEDFLRSRLDSYPMARTMEELVPKGRRVLGFNQVAESYTNTEYLVSFQSAPGGQMREIFLSALIKERQPTYRVRLRVLPTKSTAVRAVLNRTETGGLWSITELRIRNGESEIQRSPHWRLRANSNPFMVQDAFDNSQVTRWITEFGRTAGMYVEIDFGREETFDVVDLLQPNDQPWDTYHVEARDASGTWRKLATKIEPEELTSPLGMRRAAAEELLRRDIQYILIGPSDFGYDDIHMNAKVWGVEEVAERGGLRLLRLLPRDEFERVLKQ
ncbi:MAG: hypothetical protein FJW30_12270 [Acidobacteria bacterium]|nr:hypothetical protein [Acidobacteriota bacterium]